MGFFRGLLKHSQGASCVLAETHPVFLQMTSALGVDVTNSKDYKAQLIAEINSAVECFDGEVAKIPAAIDISAGNFLSSAIVQALFPHWQEIAHGLGRSMEIRQSLAFLAGAEQKETHALLGLRRSPESLHSGGAPVFCDHTLRSAAATRLGAQLALRNAALAKLATTFSEDIAAQRAASIEELHPEAVLSDLVARLKRPADYLQIDEPENQALAAKLPEPARQVELMPSMKCGDRRCWTVCFVSFPTAEGIAAIQNEAHPHRYITI